MDWFRPVLADETQMERDTVKVFVHETTIFNSGVQVCLYMCVCNIAHVRNF